MGRRGGEGRGREGKGREVGGRRSEVGREVRRRLVCSGSRGQEDEDGEGMGWGVRG